MTVLDLKEEKRGLEGAILNLIHRFEQRTHMKVESVRIHVLPSRGFDDDPALSVGRVDVSLV